MKKLLGFLDELEWEANQFYYTSWGKLIFFAILIFGAWLMFTGRWFTGMDNQP